MIALLQRDLRKILKVYYHVSAAVQTENTVNKLFPYKSSLQLV